MDREAFEKKVRQGLEKLDNEQRAHFFWRCAVRALPFLGGKGHLDFWKEEYKATAIYAIFHLLDSSTSLSYKLTSYYSFETKVYADEAINYAADAYEVAAAATDMGYASDDAADAAYAASAAANSAAYTAYTANSITTDSGSRVGFNGVAAAIAAANIYQLDLRLILLNDLSEIQKKSKVAPNTQIEFYGEIWDNFQKALKAEECEYWGKLYQDIFNSGFVLDHKTLKRRLSVPKEIREQGAAAVGKYLEELEKGASRLNEARIIILGDKGAGKTCIARRLIDPNAPMTTDKESTAGVNTTLWELQDENINVRIWDFAGHTVTHAVHQFFLSERCLYIMVYDGRTEGRNRLAYWLDHMQNYGGDSQAMILVNKRDRHSVDIKINTLKEKYNIVGKYTFSIRDDQEALQAFREKVAGYIENNPSWEKQIIPTSYYHVKDELESLFATGEQEHSREHISKKEFETIAGKHAVNDADELLQDLHYLGVSLWYREMEEFDTLVLNPEWISHGVYKIINWVNEAKRHTLALADFTTVFQDEARRYPEQQHRFLFKLMKHYELAYETERGGELIIPHLLKEDRPATLPDFPVGDSLMLRYKAEQPLPPNSISRFIVRHNQQIKKDKKQEVVWRYGVVLEDGKGSLALVREKDRTLSVEVKGAGKTTFISALRETLNDIFNSYKSEKPELQYRIERFGEIPNDVRELWLPDRKIINHHQRQKPYYDDVTDRDIPMAPVVHNYNIHAEGVMFGGQGHRFIKNTFNFHECNIGLQGNLNELAQLLTEGGKKSEAKELESAAKALEKVEASEDKAEVKKKGIANRLKRLLDELGDKNSALHKSVSAVKNGVSIAQDIAKGYNDVAQWLGLPQVPKPFLKK